MKNIYIKVCNLINKEPRQTKYKYIKKYEKEFNNDGYCFEGILEYLIDEEVLIENTVINGDYTFNIVELNISRFIEFFELTNKSDYVDILDYILKYPTKAKNTYIKEISKLYSLDTDYVQKKIENLIYEDVLSYKKVSYRGIYYNSLYTSLLDIYDFLK